MRHISESSRYDVNNVNIYLVNVVSGQYRPLETHMELKTANQYIRDRLCQYNFPYTLYACNDRIQPDSEQIAEYCKFIMKK